MNGLFITLQKKFSKVNNPKNNFLTVFFSTLSTGIIIVINYFKILKRKKYI